MNMLRELPGRAYFDAEYFAAEQRAVFARNWVHVAGGHEIPGAGDAVPVSVAGLPVVVVRQRDGAVRGFHNVCRHRGCLLVAGPVQARPVLSCPFHGWGYGLDGALLRTPHWDAADGTAEAGFEPGRFGLLPVATAVWCDQVFVRVAAEGASFEEHIAPLAARWAAYDLGALRYGGHAPYEVAANWKLVVQNFLDTYHLPFLHPQLGTVAQAKNYDDVNAGETAFGISYRAGGVEKDKGDLDMPVFAGLPARERAGQDILVLYPNTLVELVAGHLLFIRLDPVGPALTREVMSAYFVGEGATDPRWEAARTGLLASWDRLQRQDFGVVVSWQAAQVSPAAGDQPEVSPLWERSGGWFRGRVAREMAAG